MPEPKRIAAIITEYRRHSHADVIVGKILEGYNYAGRERPNLRIASMYIDQFPANDMSRALSRRFGFRIYPTIERALTLGGRQLAVDGVLSIGEHGNYPHNRLGQQLYPRRRFFEQIMRVIARSGRAVPVFNDKHLSTNWRDALWMVRRARQLHAPFMAGSSLPVTWRRPALNLPLHAPLEEAVQIGYDPFESYGFHALESLQCLAEYRRGGESGVQSVQFLRGEAMWQAMDRGLWSRELLERALARVPSRARGDYRAPTVRHRNGGVILIRYRDGFKAAIAMMNGVVHDANGGAFCFAGKLRGREQPVSTHFYLQNEDPFGHFAHLVRALEAFMHSYQAVYPVERTLLTTGVLEAAMISRHERNRIVATPHLNVRYQPTGWPSATSPIPQRIQR